MDTPRRWIQYDTYKLIVALILLVIFILLLLLKRPVPAQTGATAATPISQAAAPTAPPVSTAPAAPAVQPAASPTLLPIPSPTVPPLPQPTATLAPTLQPTAQPTAAPVATSAPTVEVTPTLQATSAAVDCPKALPARLQVGKQARITTNLNLRTSPGIGNNLIKTNPGSTQLEVIGGPVCTPYKGGAYLWWNVKLPDGTTGWSAEGSLTGKFYFLEPIP